MLRARGTETFEVGPVWKSAWSKTELKKKPVRSGPFQPRETGIGFGRGAGKGNVSSMQKNPGTITAQAKRARPLRSGELLPWGRQGKEGRVEAGYLSGIQTKKSENPLESEKPSLCQEKVSVKRENKENFHTKGVRSIQGRAHLKAAPVGKCEEPGDKKLTKPRPGDDGRGTL